MHNQLTSNAEALRLFFTEDIYLVAHEERQAVSTEPVSENSSLPLAQALHLPQIENVERVSAVTAETKRTNFEYLGKNQKGILILVNDHANKVSSPQGTELLRKLVKAIELTNNDFALVNFAHYPGATFEELNSFFNCQLLLSFGVDAPLLGLAPQPLHQLNELPQARLIFTSNLHELDGDTASKKILWTTLQRLK